MLFANKGILPYTPPQARGLEVNEESRESVEEKGGSI